MSPTFSPSSKVSNISVWVLNERSKPVSFGILDGKSKSFACKAMVFAVKGSHAGSGSPAGIILKGEAFAKRWHLPFET